MWPLPVFWPIFSSFAPISFTGNSTPPHRKFRPSPLSISALYKWECLLLWLDADGVVPVFHCCLSLGWKWALILKISLEVGALISLWSTHQFTLKPSSPYQGKPHRWGLFQESLFLLLVWFDPACCKITKSTINAKLYSTMLATDAFKLQLLGNRFHQISVSECPLHGMGSST